jgi:hypothetical protein
MKSKKFVVVTCNDKKYNLINTHFINIDNKMVQVECLDDNCPICDYYENVSRLNKIFQAKCQKFNEIISCRLNQRKKWIYINTIDENNDFEIIRFIYPTMINDENPQKYELMSELIRLNGQSEHTIKFQLSYENKSLLNKPYIERTVLNLKKIKNEEKYILTKDDVFDKYDYCLKQNTDNISYFIKANGILKRHIDELILEENLFTNNVNKIINDVVDEISNL